MRPRSSHHDAAAKASPSADAAPPTSGRIEIICGCMFSGKSEVLIDRVRGAEAAGARVAVFKHASDTRYDACDVVTHSGRRLTAQPLADLAALPVRAADADVIAIDEAQFFGPNALEVCRALAAKGKRIIVCGLDRDAWGRPFGPIPALVDVAQDVTRLTATCAVCGGVASFTQRVAPITDSMIGGKGVYEPRCETCFRAPPAELRR